MDAYLSKGAYQTLLALSLIHSNPDGLLVGHRRGHRFFVEKIFPSLPSFFPSFEKYHKLDRHFEGKLIGFFSFRPNTKKIQKLLAPFACGQLYLELAPASQKKLDIKSFVIDYENNFFLVPVELNT